MRLFRPRPASGGSAGPAADLEAVLRSGRRWRLFYLILLTMERTSVSALLLGIVFLIADWAAPLPSLVRQLAWVIGVSGLFLGSILIERNWRRLRLHAVALDVGRGMRPPDGLLNGWELVRSSAPRGVSGELIAYHVRDIRSKLAEIDVPRAVRPRTFYRWGLLAVSVLLVSGALFVTLPVSARSAMLRVYFPFGLDDLQGLLSVHPGSLTFLAGQDVTVRLRVSARRGGPELWVRGDGLRWEERPLSLGGSGDYQYVFRSLKEEVSYRVRFQGRWSPVYRLTPYRPSQWESIRVEIRYPPYTGKEPDIFENVLVIRALQGAQVFLTGRLDRSVDQAAAVFSDGRLVPAKVDGKLLSFRLEAGQSGEFSFRFGSPGPVRGAEEEYSWRLDVVPDEPPRVRVLSPAQDLLASPRDRIPVVYEAEDDFGVDQVRFHYSVNGLAKPPLVWERSEKSEARRMGDKIVALESLGLKAGDVVRYHLSAVDNNTLTGPGIGTSPSFLVEVASYEAEHARLEEDLTEFREGLIKLLGDQSVLRKEAKSENPDWKSLAGRQSSLNARAAEQRRGLESIVKAMAEDPLTDRVTLAEHQGALEALRELEKDALPRALSSLHAKEGPAAARAMDEITAELERLSLLSEDVLQSQRMRTLLQRQEDLTQNAEGLAQDLEALQAKGISEEDQRRLNDMLAEMAEMFREVAEQLQKFPEELPEEFVNDQSVKALRLEDVAQAMGNLRNALARGDAATALAEARRALEQLRDIQKTLRRAGDSLPGGPDWFGGRLMKQTDEMAKRLEGLIDKQENLKTRAAVFSEKALAERVRRQKDVLAQAAVRQKALDPAWERVRAAASSQPGSALFVQTRLPVQRVETMRSELQSELEAGQLRETPQRLPEMRAHLESLRSAFRQAQEEMAQSGGANGDEGHSLLSRYRTAEKDAASLLSRLEDLSGELRETRPELELLTEKQRDDVRRLAPEQETLRDETSALRHDIQLLSRQTALLGGRLPKRLQLAAEAMEGAAAALKAARAVSAVEDQEAALRYLRESQEDLSSASQQMRSAGSSGAGGASPSIRIHSGGGGTHGAASGPVRIPRAEEYTPPQEFREEIMRGMKESYPKDHEGVIREYYENWNR